MIRKQLSRMTIPASVRNVTGDSSRHYSIAHTQLNQIEGGSLIGGLKDLSAQCKDDLLIESVLA